MTKVAVTGSRYYRETEVVEATLKFAREVLGDFELLVGDATGADAIAAAFHIPRPLSVFRANWSEHGRAAGPYRNREMLDSGAEYLIAFVQMCDRPNCDRYEGVHPSHGTMDCITAARERNIPVLFVTPPEHHALLPSDPSALTQAL